MKKIQHTNVLMNHVYVTYEYVREHWYEWLVVEVTEGEARPLWYLPVRRYVNRFGYEVWIFPFAPFVLFAYIINNCFWSIWHDLVEFQRLTADKKEMINAFHTPAPSKEKI